MTGSRPPTPAPDAAAITATERRRIFEDAQRQADTVFAQYQLSQLLALGGDLPGMTASVIGELVRASDAVAGAIWLTGPGAGELRLVATEPDLLLGPSGPAATRTRGRRRASCSCERCCPSAPGDRQPAPD
ncbi:MAG TPA: hypothetical protein VFY23_16635, partial [Candidatus Limnocylindrales bacterium]|nr:hypothetical protein [Candidatus Limnocylindrales bacterium]